MNTTVYEIQHAETDEQINSCFELLQQLRPHLVKEGFVQQIREQIEEGYHLVFIKDDFGVQSVAGYRVNHFLAWGKTLYIDDLITRPEARGTGFGTHLLKWLQGVAKKESCNGIHLDSGITHDDAHRLYLNLGMKINGIHLAMDLD